jgi:hypothetical protein
MFPHKVVLGLAIPAVIALASLSGGVTSSVVQLAHNDRVHYGGHLLAGRLFSLSPWTAQLAETQYAKGLYHARTPRQVALLTTTRPADLRARLRETPVLVSGFARYISQHLTRIANYEDQG